MIAENAMKNHQLVFIGLLVAGLLLAGCEEGRTIQSDHPEETVTLDIFQAGLIESERTHLEQFDTATQYTLHLTFHEPFTEIVGREQVIYFNNEDVPFEEIYLRMFPNNSGDTMVVTQILVDGEEIPVQTAYKNSALRVALPALLQPGESVVLDLVYTIQIPTDFGGNYGLFSYSDGILALDQVYAIIPVYDDEEWNVEEPAPNGDMIYTDPAFFTVTVEAPADLVIAATGVLVEEHQTDGGKAQTFVAGPVRDFYLAASKQYASVSEQVGETLVTSYFPEGYEEGGEFVLDVAVNALRSFNERLGVYPYTELDLVGTPMQAAGMEYSGIVAMSTQFYDLEATFSGVPAFTYLESATAHEVAHEWFFNMIMSDQIDEPWIDEGMAQFLTSLYYEDRYGVAAAERYQESWSSRWSRVDFKPMPIDLPAQDYTEAEYGAIIYGRAPLFIQSLRDNMGEDAFMEFLKAAFSSFKWEILNTGDFQALVEETCGCDLQARFSNWVFDK